jgi:flagellar hook protein FlgE
MGIYGALSTAVTGLRAQSFALENISGNIANSQTIGFKRVDTSFLDLIPDAPTKLQTSGSVLAYSQQTNTQQGDVKSVTNSTYMAVNGSGFFVVQPALGQSDGSPVFGGANYYTRRGDFDVDKNGYLANGSGFYLMGLPVDSKTGNVSSSMPQVIQITNSFLPASPTTRINYQLNLPQLPKTGLYQESKTLGSELLKPQDFLTLNPDVPAKSTGAAALGTANASDYVTDGNSLSVKVGTDPAVTFHFSDSDPTSGTTLNIGDFSTVADLLGAMNAEVSGVTFSISGGKIVATATGTTNNVELHNSTSGLGFATGIVAPTVSQALQLSTPVNSVKAQDSDIFVAESISGGAITVYGPNGAPIDVQLRWAKVSSTDVGGVDSWQLFYLSDSKATGGADMWKNAGTSFNFGPDGALSPKVTELDLSGKTIDGMTVPNLKLSFGDGGITQFSDPNGTAGVTALNQNGYSAGQFSSVAIDNDGRVVVSYDNGQTVQIAQVITADFSASNQLKRMDGGIFAATADSGEPIYNVNGGVIGSSLESSNTDISEEFTKLIVTQQAYAAGTKIVSTADQMLQQALNMIR